MQPDVTGYFHASTHTISYVVADPDSGRAALIDTVLDFDAKSGRTSTTSADGLLDHVARHRLSVDWILETHVHADHLTAAPYLRERLGAPIGIGSAIVAVQETFKDVYNAGESFATDGSQFDRLFDDGERFEIGALEARVMHTPGHTPACATYHVGDAAFVGDTIFMPDYGSARCDFPGGDAGALFESIRRILALPGDTRLFMCHDYMPGGREVEWETTVAAEREHNIHIHDGVTEAAFVEMRRGRDATLSTPALLLPSIQVNMRGGRFPEPESNGTVYLKLPIDRI